MGVALFISNLYQFRQALQVEGDRPTDGG